MEFLIDNREKDLKAYFSEKQVSFKNLDIGDILIKFDGEPIIAIERKSLIDFSNSIKDGRYKEQKIRLKSSNIPNIIYLIEGKSTNNKISGLPYDTLVSSMISILLRDKFKIIRTGDINETISYLDKIYTKLMKDGRKYLNLEDTSEANKEYVSTIKSVKKDNLTPENCYLIQLAQIPGVSTNIAKIINKTYPNFVELIKNYQNTEECKRKDMLTEIKYEISNNKTRKIGKVVSNRVYEFIYNKNDN